MDWVKAIIGIIVVVIIFLIVVRSASEMRVS